MVATTGKDTPLGLEARVYCNCYEMGRIKVPPPDPDLVVVTVDGLPEISERATPKQASAFEAWFNSPESVCGHREFSLVHHSLGNVVTLGTIRRSIRAIVQRPKVKLPLLVGFILRNGSHNGDVIAVSGLLDLQFELDRLTSLDWSTLPRSECGYVRRFVDQMRELNWAALAVGNPIVFEAST
jgi:hypothetical protein